MHAEHRAAPTEVEVAVTVMMMIVVVVVAVVTLGGLGNARLPCTPWAQS